MDRGIGKAFLRGSRLLGFWALELSGRDITPSPIRPTMEAWEMRLAVRRWNVTSWYCVGREAVMVVDILAFVPRRCCSNHCGPFQPLHSQVLHYLQAAVRHQARWSEFLLGFNYVIHYHPGKLTSKPDALTHHQDIYPEGEMRAMP